ncbi:MAG: transporter permease, partial [Frondihabitans sp.]|nr:transporter permease [Frondihabitans sp.]
MSTQIPLRRSTATGSIASVNADTTRRGSARRRGGRNGGFNWPLTIILAVCSLSVLIPLYVTVTMAFKTASQAVDGNAFSLPAPF